MADLERMTDEIEQNLQNNLEREISTGMVGEQVMDKLRDVDEVAYVRFASVYRQCPAPCCGRSSVGCRPS